MKIIEDNGYLNVSKNHQIYWEQWGNPNTKIPIIHLHGGPGSKFDETHKSIYNPKVHRVIFHDQRGSGKSRPRGSLIDNTTNDLIQDIEALRTKFGIDKFYLAGGSWGSTLALLYAIKNPKDVEGILLWSVWLVRQCEEWAGNEGFRSYYRPEEWKRFLSVVPKDHQSEGSKIMKYYAKMVSHNNLNIAFRYAKEFDNWAEALSSSPALALEPENDDDRKKLVDSLQIFFHYSLNRCFIPEGYILDNIQKIRNIPCQLVHGRFDLNTIPLSAYDLAQAYGSKLELHWINSGHLRSDPPMLEKLQSLAKRFAN